jgi:hypothetical protein
MPMPLSRLNSIVSTSSQRTPTDCPKPSETSTSQAVAPLFTGMFQHILGQLLQGGEGIGKSGSFGHGMGVGFGKVAIIAAQHCQPRTRPMQDEDFTEGNERPSKTKMKEAMHELQDLGAELVELSVGQLKRINCRKTCSKPCANARRSPRTAPAAGKCSISAN